MESKDFILVVVSTVITLILREGGPILKEWMTQSTADRKVRSELEQKGYEAVICRLDRQVTNADLKITALEAALEASEKREYECEKRFILLEAHMKELEKKLPQTTT